MPSTCASRDSGGENISSIEIESALHQHEAVLHVAVVAADDKFWGEIPIAIVETKPGMKVVAWPGWESQMRVLVRGIVFVTFTHCRRK